MSITLLLSFLNLLKSTETCLIFICCIGPFASILKCDLNSYHQSCDQFSKLVKKIELQMKLSVGAMIVFFKICRSTICSIFSDKLTSSSNDHVLNTGRRSYQQLFCIVLLTRGKNPFKVRDASPFRSTFLCNFKCLKLSFSVVSRTLDQNVSSCKIQHHKNSKIAYNILPSMLSR